MNQKEIQVGASLKVEYLPRLRQKQEQAKSYCGLRARFHFTSPSDLLHCFTGGPSTLALCSSGPKE